MPVVPGTPSHATLLHHCLEQISPWEKVRLSISPAFSVRTVFDRSYHDRCERRNRALPLQSSSRLQPWQSGQLSLQQYQFLSVGQSVVRPGQSVSSSVEAEFWRQQHPQYEDCSRCRIPLQNTKRASCEHRLRQATGSKIKLSHSGLQRKGTKSQPPRVTEKPPREPLLEKERATFSIEGLQSSLA